MDDLKEKWKEKNTGLHYSREELKDIYDQRIHKANIVLKRRMKWDAIFTGILSLIFIVIPFILGFHSRYILAIAMIFWVIVMSLHYYIKYRLLINPVVPNKDLITILKITNTRLNSYLLIYRMLSPLFAGLLCFLFIWKYSKPEWLWFIFPVMGMVFLFTELIIRKFYLPVSREYRKILDQWQMLL